MWFDDENMTGWRVFAGKRKKSRNKSLLMVNARTRQKTRGGSRSTTMFVMVALALAGIAFVAWFGIRTANAQLFSKNDKYNIRVVDIKTEAGATISPELIREYTGLKDGENIFSFNISKIRSNFLRQAYSVRDMEITRYLPDKLVVKVFERIPIARFGRRGSLVGDIDGSVFVSRYDLNKLPMIIGYNGASLKPGDRVTGQTMAAIQLIDAADNPRLGLPVETVDVGDDEYLRFTLSNRRTIKVNWKKMGEVCEDSARNLRERLGWVSMTLRSELGRHMTELDATYAGAIYGN